MKSTKLADGTCATTGGGRIVDVPKFPGEQIDRRLLRDLKLLRKRYRIFITDGYSTDAVHAANGEHPLGLALDIAPDRSIGGTWAAVTRLALFAEPEQGMPIEPFRWVGYDGDSGHGRGHHLHLSWDHTDVRRPGRLARTVYTMRCPKPALPPVTPPEPGGTPPAPPATEPTAPTGGVKARSLAGARAFPVVVESGGVDIAH